MLKKSEHIVFRVLELDVVLKKVSELSVSAVGKERIENLSPFADKDALQEELTRITEMRDLLRYDDPFPLQEFADLRPQLKRAEVVGAFLNPEEFVALVHFLVMGRQIKDYFVHHSDKYVLLQQTAKQIATHTELEKEIRRVVDAHGQVKDNASVALSSLRRDLKRLESQARSRLEAILRGMVSKGYAQEENLVLREGRLVLPVKEAHRDKLKGIVVDQSASGVTLFIEPLDVLEMNNEIRRLKVQERLEVEKILKSLTDKVRENRFSIQENFDIAGKIDSFLARAKFSIQMNGNPASTSQDGILELKEARHPLLLMRQHREVIPLSLRMGGALKTLVITGPNAGGKTVALKTVGLLALMHQYGLHVPASEGTTFPLFTQVFADIGDRQSIEQDLSTFSSHIENVKAILDETRGESLVLLDEIGSATDPAEGAALAEAILKNLTYKGCLTIATTHMGALKIFAHEEPGVENGSMAFDQKTLCPTYRFQMGIPGSSYAFEIAERLGISNAIVKESKKLLGEERGKLDRLIFHLEEELARTHTLLKEAEIKESRLSGLVKLYQNQSDRLQKEGEEKKQEIVKKAEEVLREANAVVERVVREIRESQAQQEIVRRARRDLKDQTEKVKALTHKREEAKEASFHPGDWVTWQNHEGKGEIISEPDGSGRVRILWNGVKFRVPASELNFEKKPRSKETASGLTSYRRDEETGHEIDLRGMTADEAIETVEHYLGEASSIGLSWVRIIHGKGTGVLRREISKYLKGHPLVKSQRLGNWNEGDTGVTVVELK